MCVCVSSCCFVCVFRRSATGADSAVFADLCPEMNLEEMSSDPEATRLKTRLQSEVKSC